MKLVLLILALAMTNGHESYNVSTKASSKIKKRSYYCPPHFFRLSHRCYFFSEEAATWQQAYFQCQEFRSNLAIIRNANQDKLIRKILSNTSIAPSERWIGGLYDWNQLRWKWGASGKPLVYQGFSKMETEDKERLRWHCIILDPNLQYRWNTKSCLEMKKFICHTKVKIVTNKKSKKKFGQQYRATEFNKLNEIPVPALLENLNSNYTSYKGSHMVWVNGNYDAFATKPRTRKRRTRKNKFKERKVFQNGNFNVTRSDQNDSSRLQRIGQEADSSADHINWKTYLKKPFSNPLHPKTIVEEFHYMKHS